jgi:hypothetical protein
MGRRAVKITADNTTLVRAPADVVEIQSRIARDLLERAELAAITLPALCELVWVMARGYDEPRDRIAAALRTWLAGRNPRSDMAAVGAGLRFLDEAVISPMASSRTTGAVWARKRSSASIVTRFAASGSKVGPHRFLNRRASATCDPDLRLLLRCLCLMARLRQRR